MAAVRIAGESPQTNAENAVAIYTVTLEPTWPRTGSRSARNKIASTPAAKAYE
jgi:hypothetical protein